MPRKRIPEKKARVKTARVKTGIKTDRPEFTATDIWQPSFWSCIAKHVVVAAELQIPASALVLSVMPCNQEFAVRAFGCTLVLSASCPVGHRALDRWIFPSLPRNDSSSRVPDISIHVEKAAGEFAVYVDGSRAASVVGEDTLGLNLIRAVDEALISRLTTLRVVHAGAVRWRERALLLPGRTHSGKSSLVIELLRQGAGYLSDEYALIDNEGLVHAYPRPLLVRTRLAHQTPVLPEIYGKPAARSALPVGWIVASQYSSEADWKLTALTQSEGLMLLLQNTPHVLADMPEITSIFGRAVAGARCYAGYRNHATEAAKEILRFIDRMN
jgi:hypothetical protein